MEKETKTASVKPKFLIIDGINDEQHEVESFKQYEDYCNDLVKDDEGIHPELEMIELYQRVGYPVVIDTGEYASTINGIEAIYEVCFFNELTQQQEINTQLKAELESWKTENFENVDQANKTIDQLKKANEELLLRLNDTESAIEGSDIKIYDLKKQNEELLKELKSAIKYLKFVDSLSDKLEFDSVSHEGEKTKLKNTLGFSGARELIQNTTIKIES